MTAKVFKILLCICVGLLVVGAKHPKKHPKNPAQPPAPSALQMSVGNWQDELRMKIAQARIPAWMWEQIYEDLAPYQASGIALQDIEFILDKYHDRGFVVCTIQDNEFTWTCYRTNIQDDFRARLLVEGIQTLSSTVSLPDVVFLVYVGESFPENENKPVLSWCKHKTWGKGTISIPDYEALSGNDSCLREVNEGISRYPWHSKINIAFWRGAAVGGWGFEFMPRLKLVQVASQNPQYIDAKFNGTFPGQDLSVFAPFLENSVSITEHLRYKYQILPDGHVSAFSRAYWQLFANCAIFKQASPWYQWYYRALRPYEHYIPYEADASNLVQQIQWAQEHDAEVKKIVENANDFANNNLKHADVMLYFYLVICEYAKLQTWR